MSLESLRKLNSYPISSVLDPAFSDYGKVVESPDVQESLAWLSANTEIPEAGIYVPTCSELESLPLRAKVAAELFGYMEIQLGYCNGRTAGLDALEYHKSPEYTAADADVVLFLSSSLKMRGGRLPREAIEAFFLPAGLPVELYPLTMHFAPCATRPTGYRSFVALPKGTNCPIEAVRTPDPSPEAGLLFSKNKWLVAHPSCGRLLGRGVKPGLEGERIELRY
jgi:hypothetical protein